MGRGGVLCPQNSIETRSTEAGWWRMLDGAFSAGASTCMSCIPGTYLGFTGVYKWLLAPGSAAVQQHSRLLIYSTPQHMFFGRQHHTCPQMGAGRVKLCCQICSNSVTSFLANVQTLYPFPLPQEHPPVHSVVPDPTSAPAVSVVGLLGLRCIHCTVYELCVFRQKIKVYIFCFTLHD